MTTQTGPTTKQTTESGTLTTGDGCDTIGGKREVPIHLLAPGDRFELYLSTTGRRWSGTLVRKGPGTVAVVLDHAEKERTFTTREGDVIRLTKSGGIIYWQPGTPVLRLDEPRRDVTRWTTKGGTGVGPNPDHPSWGWEDQQEKENSAMGERTAVLPVGGSKPSAPAKLSKRAKAKAAKAAKRVPKPLNDCLDGCGEKVSGRFRQGHDARYYSILKKVSRGEMAFNEMPKLMQSMLQNVAGVKRELAKSKH